MIKTPHNTNEIAQKCRKLIFGKKSFGIDGSELLLYPYLPFLSGKD